MSGPTAGNHFGMVCLAALVVCSVLSQSVRAAEPKLKIPEPQMLSLDARDGVVVRCSFYPGGFVENYQKKDVIRLPGKEVVPVIMLHGWGGQRQDYDYTASFLQKMGHAVVVPDLRGHGESRTRRMAGREVTLDRESMSRRDLEAMVLDVEAIKKFLLEKNNAQELNIEMLCVVGAEFGAMIAINWAVLDWSWPQLPAFKQGCDVKALALLSPLMSFRGVTANKALQHPVIHTGLSIMIVAGKDDRSGYSEAKKLHSRLERYRETPPTDPQERQKKQDLFLVEPATSLSGTKLLTPRGLTVNQDLLSFIYWRLTNRKDLLPWAERKGPLPSE